MIETAWSAISEDAHWERVRWGRLTWQRKAGREATMRDAAEALGMRENTYAAYERRPDSSKSTGLSLDRARQFGRKFGVSWVWLMSGEGTPFDAPSFSPEAQRLAQRVDQAPEGERPGLVAAIETLLGRTGTRG